MLIAFLMVPLKTADFMLLCFSAFVKILITDIKKKLNVSLMTKNARAAEQMCELTKILQTTPSSWQTPHERTLQSSRDQREVPLKDRATGVTDVQLTEQSV